MVVMLILSVAQSRGVLLFGDDCDESDCGDSCDFGKNCPPECPTCTCATASSPTVPTVYATIAPPILNEASVEHEYEHTLAPSPDPREILHVPRPIAI